MHCRTFQVVALAIVTVFAPCHTVFGANTYYVAPTTSGTANGSITNPFTSFTTAMNTAVAGDTIYVRGGTYNLSSAVSISKNGTAANPFKMFAYPGEAPILDFRGEAYNASNGGQRGVSLSGSYWHIKGLTIQYAADNGIIISGSNSTVEQVIARQNQDSGFLIGSSNGSRPSNNLLLNCDSYGNYDFGNGGENADGFAAKERGLGAGNVISGARAYDNSDDGFDFWAAESGVTVVNSWSFHNGLVSSFNNPSGFLGDGNGIKLGHDSGTHVLKNMLVWGNPANGVDVNGNATALEGDPPTIAHGVTVHNVTSAMNGKNFQFDENPTTASPPTAHILRNNVSYSGSTTITTGNTADHNTFNGPSGSPVGLGVTAADFLSTTVPVATWSSLHPAGTGGDRSGTTTPVYATGLAVGPRQSDGSLPLIDFLRLAPGSHLIGAGVDVGLPYSGAAPDVSWYQTQTTAPPVIHGDYNGDNVVDLADYALWRKYVNTSTTLPNDLSPGVNAHDYNVWRTYFGNSAGSGTGIGLVAVPEPRAELGLALVAVLLATSRTALRALSQAARRIDSPNIVS